MKLVMMILGIILVIMSALLLLVNPLIGICGIIIAIFNIWVAKYYKKPLKQNDTPTFDEVKKPIIWSIKCDVDYPKEMKRLFFDMKDNGYLKPNEYYFKPIKEWYEFVMTEEYNYQPVKMNYRFDDLGNMIQVYVGVNSLFHVVDIIDDEALSLLRELISTNSIISVEWHGNRKKILDEISEEKPILVEKNEDLIEISYEKK